MEVNGLFLLLDSQKELLPQILYSNTLTWGEPHAEAVELASWGPWTMKDQGSCV